MGGIDKPVYQQQLDEVFVRFSTRATGLTDDDASSRLREQGPNALTALKRVSAWRKYFRQYRDGMVLLLLASVGIALYLGDIHTAVVLVALIIFNTLIGFTQEYRAEKTMEALERLVVPMAEVLRNGKLRQIDSRSLVTGDVIKLSEGQSVPADVRLVEVMALSTNDFALTGESNPSRKFTHALDSDVPLGNRHNLTFMGTTVATGEAIGVVVATGMNTELGRIASLSQAAPEHSSPLQKEVAHIATVVTYGVTILSLGLLTIAMYIHLPLKDALLFAVGVASSLIPQGLPAEINTALAQAAGKLARSRALVKKLSAVETLGATQVICTDKTGTLTKNQMTAVSFAIGSSSYTLSGVGYSPEGLLAKDGSRTLTDRDHTTVRAFLRIGALASNATLIAPTQDMPEWTCLGDPTEGALVVAARKLGVTPQSVEQWKEIREFPFDSSRKRMTSVRRTPDGVKAFVKGAPEAILERATMYFDGVTTKPLTPAMRRKILQMHTARAGQALRNLAFATRSVTEKSALSGTHETIERELTYHGLISMIDPLRETVPAAIKAALQANIKINVVTGDFALTAEALARQAGLIAHGTEATVITGDDLTKLHDNEVLAHTMRGGTIFSRVSPEDKMRIVSLVKRSGAVVAVTGDGINDAPALTYADIGVAMGITGTDVAKQASEVVLLDDSFASLVSAIRQGRTIYANIKKGVLSCFTSNFTELVVNLGSLLLTSLFALPLALNVLQLLAIDMLAELFPIAALGWDKEEGEMMKAKPRNPRRHILNTGSLLDLTGAGLVMGLLALANFVIVVSAEGGSLQHPVLTAPAIAHATTMTYVTIVICQLINITQRRSAKGMFTTYQFHNKVYWLAVAFSIGIVLAVCYIPSISLFFKSAPLSALDWLYVIGAAAVYLVYRELLRLFRRSAVTA